MVRRSASESGLGMRIARVVFAATMVGLGLWGLVNHDFAAIWQPVPKRWPAREALVWVSGVVALACGLGLLWRRTAALAGGVLTAVLLVWMLVFKASVIVRAPGVAAAWESCGETAVSRPARGCCSPRRAPAGASELRRRGKRASGWRGPLRSRHARLRRRASGLREGDRRARAELAAGARGLGLPHRRGLHHGGPRHAGRRLGAAGRDAVGGADRRLHAAGLGPGRGGAGRGSRRVERGGDFLDADRSRLGGGGVLPRRLARDPRPRRAVG